MTRLAIFVTLAALLSAGSLLAEPPSDADSWDQKYQQLLRTRPEIRAKVERGDATKEEVIAWMKKGGDRPRRKGQNEYYGGKIEVQDPSTFYNAQQERIYSGPQPGEPLPAFQAIRLRGDQKGHELNPVAAAEGKPLVLIFQDRSVGGQKGLLLWGGALARIADKSPHGLCVSTTFLVDDPTLSKIFEYDFMDKINQIVEMSVSPDRRDGPGAYGLNRNVAMTILIAKDGKVLHNFAFQQPMLYADPHVFGAIAGAIGVDRTTLAGWFRAETTEAATSAKGKPQDAKTDSAPADKERPAGSPRK